MTGSRKRLLVLSPSADLYGSDRSLLVALPALLTRYDLTLVTAADGPLIEAAEALGVECHVAPDWALRRSMLQPAAAVATMRRVSATLSLIRRLHADRPFVGIYANTIANAALPFLKRAVRVPLVVHVRELPRDRPRQLKVLLGMVDRHADAVLCNSSFTAEVAIEMRPRLADRTRVVLNSIPEPATLPRPAPRDGRLHIGCVGRIHPKKGHEDLVRAAAIATAQGADWALHMHGDALPEHAELEASLHALITEHGLGDRVSWHGYAGDTDRLYDQLDLVVVPSVIPEEFSRVGGEAQIRGLPVVATGPGGPSEILTDGVTGHIVAPRCPDELATALMSLEADPVTRRQMGVRGREQARVRLSTERYRREVLAGVSRAVEQQPSVLVLSPSADLYGSDRALLHALPALVDQAPVLVAHAAPGPLAARVRQSGGAAVETSDFAFRRRLLNIRGLPRMLGRSVRSLVSIRRLVRRHRVGLIYVNTVAVSLIPVLRFLLRRRVLVHVHERALGGRQEAALIRWGIRVGADLVVTNSEFTAKSLGGVDPDVIQVVHNGVEETDPPTHEQCRRSAREPGDIRLVAVARLHPKKGYDVLIDAVGRLAPEGIDVRLDIVGDALPEHRSLELALHDQVARLHLEEAVTFHGYRDDVDLLYRSADVVVVPSVHPEEFSLVAAEGQMRGLPAIVSGPGGVTEVVEPDVTGLMVTAGDATSLADAIRTLALDPALATDMGDRGRTRMLERFTVDTYRRRVAAIVGAQLTESEGTRS